MWSCKDNLNGIATDLLRIYIYIYIYILYISSQMFSKNDRRSLHQGLMKTSCSEPVCNDFLVDKEPERVTNEMHVERIVFGISKRCNHYVFL